MTYHPDDPDSVRGLFGAVAPRYDILNTLISFGCHSQWRKFAAACADLRPGQSALDVCCGTGDMAIALARAAPGSTVVGVDFASAMLEPFAAKVRKAPRGRAGTYHPICADALTLPLRDGSFDAATAAFGLRNIPERGRALQEMHRVLKTGGRLVILDAAKPRGPLARMLFNVHFRVMVPVIGWLFTGWWGLYSYLPASLERYPSREELAELVRHSGFVDVRWFDLAHGAATVHVGAKP